MTARTDRPMSTNEAAERLYTLFHAIRYDVKSYMSEAEMNATLDTALAHERSAGTAPLDVDTLPSGARLSLQKGDDYGNGPWYAVVENTIDLPDQDTARLGSGETPQEAMDTAISRFARLAKGTDR